MRTKPLTAGIAFLSALALIVPAAAASTAPSPGSASAAAAVTTAWKDGRFVTDPAGIVSRSDIVLAEPNTDPSQSMPLGDGQLGAAVWAANGMTIQLNRADTMPYRYSPGWIVIPGLSELTGAPDFHAVLNLYDGTFTESGGGMTATVRVEADSPDVVVSVTGADPAATQSAQVELWAPRTPTAAAAGPTGVLSQTWTDAGDPAYPGGTGQTYGSLAAITASGQDVTASAPDSLTARVTFRPHADGSFSVVVASPHWAGGNALAAARSQLADAAAGNAADATAAWWHRYWQQTDPMELDSADGTASYMENLRTVYLYAAAAERGSGDLAGSQAGTADLFSWLQDSVKWDPAAYWIWNQRMQLAANQGAGDADLNDPFFGMYRDDLANIRAWTEQQFPGMPGLCVPETMRFNGNGYSNGTQAYNGGTHATENLSCSSQVPATYNGEDITSGAELSLYAWRQYQDTGDTGFLAGMYPLMPGVAQFLLAYAKPGADGLLHTVANAHETQWEVQDPTTDIAAMQAVFPVIIAAARTLHRDPGLVAQLQSALTRLPQFPRADAATETQLLPPSADQAGDDVIAESYDPSAPRHNTENIGLELVWPYQLLGASSELAQRTFADRLFVDQNDWSFDAVDAAELDQSAAVEQNLVALTEKYQKYASGMAQFSGNPPYVEQSANVALALQLALVQDDAGVVTVAPAWPAGWNVSGSVAVTGNSKVDVQVENGTPVTVAVEAGSAQTIRVADPWPGQTVQVLTYSDGRLRAASPETASATVTLAMQPGDSYLIQRTAQPTGTLPFAPVTGQPATACKTLGSVTIGIC
jgi:hypothetical protein